MYVADCRLTGLEFFEYDKEKQSNWIFGGSERLSKKFFAMALGLEGNRRMTTLEPLMIKQNRPGSIIVQKNS